MDGAKTRYEQAPRKDTMTPVDFERLCGDLHTFTTAQRAGLLELLQSRIWLYESEDFPEFERIYEFDDCAITIILREVDLETLAYALKGASEALRKKIFKNMPKAELARLNRKMKALGPVRKSLCDQAKERILETLSLLASKGEIELPVPLNRVSFDFTNGESTKEPGSAINDHPPREVPIDHTADLLASFQTMTVDARGRRPKLRTGADGTPSLSIDSPGGELILTLDAPTLKHLGQLCAPYAVEASGEAGAVFDEARKLQARVLVTLPDHGLKLLLRDVDVVVWADLLCYINDVHLTRKVFAFGAPGFVNALMTTLTARCLGEKSAAVREMQLEKGRHALQSVLAIFYQYCDEGQIWVPGT